MNPMPVPDIESALLDQIQSQLDLRQPNRDAIETLALRLNRHYAGGADAFYEGVVDVATGVGKTYILAGAIDYFAALGCRNFAVICPGSTILKKTIAQFSGDNKKSLLEGMSVKPHVIHADNFATASKAAEFNDDSKVKLFVFSVQSLIKPTTKAGRKAHDFQEGLGGAFYQHLDDLEDLIVFADEHHTYDGPKYSAAIRDLTPYALIGLTATPNEKTLKKVGIPVVYRYPLAAAIADKLVKTPVVVGRKDDRTDEKTQLLDGGSLLIAKEKALKAYCQQAGLPFIHPVMLVNCKDIEHAEEVGAFLASDQFYSARFAEEGSVLTVHSNQADEALARLDEVEETGSPTRIIVQVGMLKEGWDVKNVYVIVSLRSSVSDVLTEQTLGRGLRLPFGGYTDVPLLNELEVVAHERYSDLLKRSKSLSEDFIDQRTALAEEAAKAGEADVSITEEGVEVPFEASESGVGTEPGTITLASTEDRKKQADQTAKDAETPMPPLRELANIQVPVIHTEVIPSEFRLQLVTDLAPFREVGRKLAEDPDRYLRRSQIEAEISEEEGARFVTTKTTQAEGKIEAARVNVPLDEARQQVIKDVVRSPYVPSRQGEPAQVERLLDAVLDGAGKRADVLLSNYSERLVRAMLNQIVEVKRKMPSGTQTNSVTELKPFAPRPRFKRAKTSGDLKGVYARGMAYVGWKRHLYEQAWFDSRTEREMATLLDGADEIDIWVRLNRTDMPIIWAAGNHEYNPDFLAIDKAGAYWLIETKSDKDLPTPEVQGKRDAAHAWTNTVSASEEAANWRYLLVAERDLEAAKDSWPHVVKATSP